jgi:chromosome segregation ATPase
MALETHARQLDEATKQKDRYGSALEGFRNEAAGLQAAIKTLTAQLKRLVLTDYAAQSLVELEQKRIAFLEVIQGCLKHLSTHTRTLNTLQQQLNTLKGRMGRTPNSGAGTYSLAADKGLTAGSLENSRTTHPLAEIMDVLSQELDFKGRTQTMHRLQGEHGGAQKTLAMLTDRIGRQAIFRKRPISKWFQPSRLYQKT